MSSRFIRGLLLLAAMGFASPALSATYLVYVPTLISVAGQPIEVYGTQGFSAHDGLSGAPLADASLAELRRIIPEEMAKVVVQVAGNTAVINLRSGDPNAPMPDRVAGAVFHTMKMAGLKEVKFGDEPLSVQTFSRGALAPVLPFVAALPPMQLTYGYVKVGTSLMGAEEFQRRFASRDKVVAAAVLRALRNGAAEAKLAVLNRTSQLPIKDLKGELILRLKDKDQRVRLKALEMLDGRRDQKTLNALEVVVARDPLPEAQMRAARILVAAGKKAYEKYLLLEDLKSTDASVAVAAMEKLIKIGDPKMAPGIEPLIRNSSPDVRAVAIKALHTFKEYGMLEKVVEAKDVNNDVQQASARILADEAVGRQRTLGVVWLLNKGARDQAAHAAHLAGAKRVAGTIEALGASLKRTEPEVRGAAARSLGTLKDIAGLQYLASALGATKDKDETALYTEQAISILGVQRLDVVAGIGKSNNIIMRQLAVKALPEFSKDRVNPDVMAELKVHAKDQDQEIRRAAIYALARVKSPEVTRSLLTEHKKNRDAVVREQVAFSVRGSDLPAEEAEAAILGFLNDGDSRVLLQAVHAVRERKIAKAFDTLKMLLRYRDPEVKREVFRSFMILATPGDPSLFDTYSNLLYDTDPEVKLMAVNSLEPFLTDSRTVDALGGAVTDDDHRVRIRSLEVLSNSQSPNATEQVIRGLVDLDSSKAVKMGALEALAKLASLASPTTRKALQEFIKNEDDADVQKRAMAVLDTL
ncbi:MAG: HEAT repeat domain-containing protein [Myxococcota bacterium]|nr:HEAT repeat domain-containing protein [Myxococcota bacterium]